MEDIFKKVSSLFGSSSSSGVTVSETKGDGRGNDLHYEAGAPGGKGGQFAPKGASTAGTSIEGSMEEPPATNAISNDRLNELRNIIDRRRLIRQAPTMRNFWSNRKKIIQERQTSGWNKVSVKEQKRAEMIRPMIRDMIANSNLTKYIKFNDFIGVLKSGEVRNQFSTKKSDGCYSFSTRMAASKKMFGHELTDFELGTTLEKYGMLQAKNINDFFSELGGGAWQYGDSCHISLVFKRSSLFDRTTYCLGDSLNTGVFPQKLNLPFDAFTCVSTSGLTRGTDDEFLSRVSQKINKPCAMAEMFGHPAYTECQFHGDLPVKDISTVVIGGRSTFLNKEPEKRDFVLKKLQEYGIRCLINTGANKLEQINLDESGNIYYTTFEGDEIPDD